METRFRALLLAQRFAFRISLGECKEAFSDVKPRRHDYAPRRFPGRIKHVPRAE